MRSTCTEAAATCCGAHSDGGRQSACLVGVRDRDRVRPRVRIRARVRGRPRVRGRVRGRPAR